MKAQVFLDTEMKSSHTCPVSPEACGSQPRGTAINPESLETRQTQKWEVLDASRVDAEDQ